MRARRNRQKTTTLHASDRVVSRRRRIVSHFSKQKAGARQSYTLNYIYTSHKVLSLARPELLKLGIIRWRERERLADDALCASFVSVACHHSGAPLIYIAPNWLLSISPDNLIVINDRNWWTLFQSSLMAQMGVKSAAKWLRLYPLVNYNFVGMVLCYIGYVNNNIACVYIQWTKHYNSLVMTLEWWSDCC